MRGWFTMNLRCLLIVAVLVFGGREASAQHIYLDTDGDGIHTSSDVLRAIGNTEVSVYLDTSHDADGPPRDCNAHSGAGGTGNLGFFSYDLILRVEPNTGSVRWGEYADANGFTPDLRDRGGSGEILISRRGSSALPPGKYLLGKITVTPTAGVPVLGVATMSKLEPAAFTGFGTPCSGSEYLNSYVLGVDWPAGADGKLATQAVTAATPTLTPPPRRPVHAKRT